LFRGKFINSNTDIVLEVTITMNKLTIKDPKKQKGVSGEIQNLEAKMHSY
jgi:hypothetical protein